jgi:DNA-directed RNA polymerase specialized sigma24 family protein
MPADEAPHPHLLLAMALYAADATATLGAWRAALNRLTARETQAVVYHVLYGLPAARVGELLGVSRSVADQLCRDGLHRLRRQFREPGEVFR